jgi:hypothetical protein
MARRLDGLCTRRAVMSSKMANRSAQFLNQWIQDNIAGRYFPEPDLELVQAMCLMCEAEASAAGITFDDLEAKVDAELSELIISAIEKTQANELKWYGVSGMPSTAQH